MDEVIIPYACMSCGRVEFFLKNRETVQAEYEDLLPEEKERLYESDRS